MKSAYEIALERLEQQGIERPREDALSDEQRREIEELRSRAKARIAQLEILHRDRAGKLGDPAAAGRDEETFRLEKRRIEDDCERKIEAVRRRSEGS